MERRIAQALAACAHSFEGLRLECVLADAEDGCTCLVGAGDACFVLKIGWDRRAGMLRGEWGALKALAARAPGCAPCPLVWGEEAAFTWLLREYVAGQTLAEWVAARGAVPDKEAVAAARALALLMKSVHEAGLVCRDIKPENLVRTPEGRWLLIDAGTVRTPAPDKPRDTVLYATEGFAAPEQFGFQQTDQRADVYALGVTLCCLFTGGTDAQALRRPGIARRVRRVVGRCMAFAPDARYQSMGAVARALDPARGRRTALFAGALALMCALSAWAYLALHPRVPVADTYEALYAAIEAVPQGADATIRVEGLIEAKDVLHIRDKRITLVGDGTVTNTDPKVRTLQIEAPGELVLTGGVTLQNTGEENCIAMRGGRLSLAGGTVKQLREQGPTEDICPLLVMEGGQVDILGGHIYARRNSYTSIGINIGAGCTVTLYDGRIDAMGDGCIGVLVGKDAVFDMRGGMINAIARGDYEGYAVNNHGFGTIRYTGGDMLVNGLPSVPLELAYTPVTSYDQLVTAIAMRSSSGRLLIEGAIEVPEGIRINGDRQIELFGRDENARLIAGGDYLFVIEGDSRLTLRELALAGNATLLNWGELQMQGMNVELPRDVDFIRNHGGKAQVLYGNSIKADYGLLLQNDAGGTAVWTANATTGGPCAIVNEGELLLKQGFIDLTDANAAWVDNRADGRMETDRFRFRRNGAVVEMG